MAESPQRPTLTKLDLVLIIFIAAFTGFIGGFVGGAITGGEWHFYIDSFTGPGHIAGELSPEELPSD